MNAVLYQAYGSIDNINECRYSLLKMIEVYHQSATGEFRVVIYTDQPELFEAYKPYLNLHLRNISAQQIKQWRGEVDFVHRVKIEIIKDFLQINNVNLLYCDTDTYLLHPIDELFSEIEKGTFLMHEYEGKIDGKRYPSFAKWDKFLKRNHISTSYQKVLNAPAIKMWNAGVIGISSRQRFLLNNVLELTDTVYKRFPKHIAEQFAFSYVFQNAGIVNSASKGIAHYWNLKEFRILLKEFFNKHEHTSIPEQINKISNWNPLAMQEDKIRYKRLPVIKRFIESISRNRWNIYSYQLKQ